MFKILNFLVISFLFFIIFSFSHIFYLFGTDIVIDIFWRGGYEWVKSSIILLYWVFFSIWLFFYLLKYKLVKKDYRLLIEILIITFLICVSTILSISPFGSLVWLSEKFHWLLFFLSLIVFFVSVFIWFEKQDYKRILNYIFLFSIPLYVYGIIQFIWFDALAIFYETRVPVTRASSFLWNANYLAWYILMLLPLSKFINYKILRILFLIISFIVLLMTGSYFWIFLWIVYFLYLIYYFNKNIFILSLVSLTIWAAFLCNSLSIEKLWSMLARPFIWETSIIAIIDTPKTILFGYWPDTLQIVFDKFKVEELSTYETSYYTADRTHNIFLDFIYFFWLLAWWIISWFMIKWFYISEDRAIKVSIFLFLLFFCFNIPISIHFILVLLLLAWIYSKELNK